MKRDDGLFWRYWLQVVPVGKCYQWIGTVHVTGYGVLKLGRIQVYAHRFAYWLFKGPVPVGKVVCHSCDTRLCVNPEHLSAGTYSRNLQEAWSRRRRTKPSTLVE